MLALRRRVPALFGRGDYRPLQVNGPLEDHIVGFARSFGTSELIVVAPRLVYRLLQNGDGGIKLDSRGLGDGAVLFPERIVGRRFYSLLASDKSVTARPSVSIQSLLEDFPIAVLYATEAE